MAKVEFPTELTKAYWDKKKPVLAKTKKTGIGEALASLKKAHDDIKWQNFDSTFSAVAIENKLKELPGLHRDQIKPIMDMAADVKKLAKKWSTEFTKEKLIPKSAAAATDAVAEAAQKYYDKLSDFEGEQANELVAKRKEFFEGLRKTLKPSWTKTADKVNAVVKDIVDFAKSPTKDNYWKIFSGDCNARGYTTGCKNWDQIMIEYPELRDQCYKGSAMDDFFPSLADYGANYDEPKFDRLVNVKTGATGDDCYRWHAVFMLKQVPNIKKFHNVCTKLLTLLG